MSTGANSAAKFFAALSIRSDAPPVRIFGVEDGLEVDVEVVEQAPMLDTEMGAKHIEEKVDSAQGDASQAPASLRAS